MRRAIGLGMMVLAAAGQALQPPERARSAGVHLEEMTWRAAEDRLKGDTVVVIPIAAGAVQHGLHLPMDTHRRLASYLTRRIVDDLDVAAAPGFTYEHVPTWSDYPGSTSLSLSTARDLTADVARSLARYGPRRFYALNTSRLAAPALDEAAKVLAREGLLLRYTDARGRLETAARSVQRQPMGNHADEIETSMLLFIDPGGVDMSRASRELAPESSPFLLSRREGGRGTHSATGVFGDASRATPQKGAVLVDALLRAIRADVDDLRRTPPPVATEPAPGADPRVPAGSRPGSTGRPNECLPGDERTIRAIGPAFAVAWIKQDPQLIAGFWAADGDMVHPDGFIEGSALRILENRTALFMRPEYKNSRHSLAIGAIRCIAPDVAIADGKWEMRNVSDASGQIVPPSEGLCTLVLKRAGGRWAIEAWRYSMQPQHAASPTLLQRPGFLKR
jgi:creatinine amidohydrolase